MTSVQQLSQQRSTIIPLNALQFSLPLLLFLLFLIKWITRAPKTSVTINPPPSPPAYPILGNFHQLSSLPHRSLHELSQTYGQVMLLHLGTVPTLVVSCPDAAREIMKTHDLVFACKPESKRLDRLFYNRKDITSSPYGEYWRQLKSIFVLQLVSNKRVRSYRRLREEETELMIENIRRTCSSSAVDLSELFTDLTNDVMCRAAFRRKYTEEGEGKEVKKLLGEILELLTVLSFGDFIPWLGWVDRITGLNSRVEKAAKKIDEFLEGVIEERELKRQGGGDVAYEEDADDFLDILLKIQSDSTSDFSLEREGIKGLLLDAYLGGTDTTATALEWTMSELLKHPDAMKKLQNEVREVMNRSKGIADEDLDRLQYLKAVIKESLRLHPPFALQGRSASQGARLMGYDIAAGTIVLVNAWSIGQDPKLYDKPQEFCPERFLNSLVDFRGQDFQLIPFGSGRRSCPGVSFATAIIEYVLANLVRNFDWDLPDQIRSEGPDMSERPGAALHRKVPLLAVATPCSF